LGGLSDLNVFVFEPGITLDDKKMVHNKKVPDMTPGRAALIELIHRYLDSLLDPYVTLMEIHKLMYFMQESGENLKLKFAKAPYGPYAENLRHVLHAIEGHFISGYADGGDAPKKQIALVPGAYEDAASFLGNHSDSKSRIERVASLVEGFETPFGLELLATVHWVMTRENSRELGTIIERTYAWGERKKQFSSRQIELATKTLSEKNWIN
jgi:O-acetyl-ADP-ribose deacetylase (regulator of RNase III)